MFNLNTLGKGTPVDEMDRACKKWQQCRACTLTDDSSCSPRLAYNFGEDFSTLTPVFDGSVTTPTGSGKLPNLRHTCEHAWNNSCMERKCLCDEALANTLYHHIDTVQFSGIFITDETGHGFDHVSQGFYVLPKRKLFRV